MAILTDPEIKKILLENPTKKLWTDAAADARKLQMHVLGHGLQSYITLIENYESAKGQLVRKKYCKSNRDLFARLLRPVDNIWNGRGGGTFYDTSEPNQKALRKVLSNVYKGFSVRAWIEKFWMPRYIDDPMGILFMEVDNDGTYPTYKASRDIFDAVLNGRRFEYIVFRTVDPAIFRVVDDVKDILVKMSPDSTDDQKVQKVKMLSGREYPKYVNYFQEVPAMIISDLPKDGNVDMYMSPITDEVELADVYLRDGSIANIYRFKNGFPLPWKYPEVCGKCKGQKLVGGATCGDCNGSGIKIESRPGDMTVFAWPTKDEVEIKDKGGFISPDLKYLEYADASQKELEELIDRTHWGTVREKDPNKGGDKETATGRFIDVQPIKNRLIKYAKAGEGAEEFITNMEGKFHFNTAYVGCAVNFGRRFMIGDPDEIWTKYQDARTKVGSVTSLDDILREYYETLYQANPQELQKSLQMIKLEPGVHMTIGEVKANLPWVEYIKKVYFSQWVNEQPENYIAFTPLDRLRTELQDYAVQQAAEAPLDPNAVKLDANNNPIVAAKPAGAPVFG